MEADLSGKSALVTGASSGIGWATAAALASRGARVMVCARRSERLDELAARFENGRIVPYRANLRDLEQIAAMFEHIRSSWGAIDILVNNAGLGHHAPLVSGDPEKWREMLELNVLALCACTREAVAAMREHRDCGDVVHISSMSAHRVPAGSGVYSATKFAVRSLTEGLRAELRALGSKIRVTAVSPGFVETEFAEKFHGSAEAAQKTYGRYPVLQPEDVARAVVYAVSQPPHVQLHDVLMRPTEQPT